MNLTHPSLQLFYVLITCMEFLMFLVAINIIICTINAGFLHADRDFFAH